MKTEDVAPEVAAAQELLDGLPEGWGSPELAATVLRRARIRAAGRVLAEQVSAAQAAASAALAALIEGDVSAAGELAGAEAARAAAERAAGLLPAPTLDPAPVEAAITKAVQGWAQADADLRLPTLDVEAEVEAWTRACAGRLVPLVPVEIRDADREVMAALPPVRGRLAAWREFAATWARMRLTGTTDPMSLLASAAQYLTIAGELAGEVTEAAEAIEAANARRRAAGSTWSVQTATVATVAR